MVSSFFRVSGTPYVAVRVTIAPVVWSIAQAANMLTCRNRAVMRSFMRLAVSVSEVTDSVIFSQWCKGSLTLPDVSHRT